MRWLPGGSESLAFVAVLSGGFALMISFVAGPVVASALKKVAGERVRSASAKLDELHSAKQNTPTMGGVLIVACAIAGQLFFGQWSDRLLWLMLATTVGFGVIGCVDDLVKLTTSRRGLSARAKLFWQTVAAAFVAAALTWSDVSPRAEPDAENVLSLLPSLNAPLARFLWAIFVIVATCNAVNLTDGLDGLAAGCSGIAAMALVVVGCSSGVSVANASSSSAVVSAAALAGSTLGFLRVNRHPAQLFMGDTGALAIGGLLAIVSMSLRCELLFAIIGGVFVIETLSVIVQVFWYRRTGRRVLLCSPLHNHFVFQRVPERRIVRRFWLAALLCAIAGVVIGCCIGL